MDPAILVSVLIGIGLAAATGFRVFVPLLIMSLADRANLLTLDSSFEWIGSDPALVALAAATVVEAAVYLVPWLDHLLDVVATPAAVVAGAVAAAAVVTDMPPYMVWSLAAIGGGTAGLVQTGSVVARGASTLTTGGLANPLVAIGELAGSIVVSAAAILAPVIAALIVVMVFVVVFRRRSRRRLA